MWRHESIFECCWELSGRERNPKDADENRSLQEREGVGVRVGKIQGPPEGLGWEWSSSSRVRKHRVWLQIGWEEHVGVSS